MYCCAETGRQDQLYKDAQMLLLQIYFVLFSPEVTPVRGFTSGAYKECLQLHIIESSFGRKSKSLSVVLSKGNLF